MIVYSILVKKKSVIELCGCRVLLHCRTTDDHRDVGELFRWGAARSNLRYRLREMRCEIGRLNLTRSAERIPRIRKVKRWGGGGEYRGQSDALSSAEKER